MNYFISKKKLLIVVALVSSTTVMSQTFSEGVIKGNLIDASQNGPVSSTVVLKRAPDSSLYKTALSDKLGYFIFNGVLKGLYILEVKSLGYETNTIKNLLIDETKSVLEFKDLQLLPRSMVLNEVTVKAEVPFIERTNDRIIVNIENQITMEGNSMLEVMDKLPGVQVNQDGQITLNGKSGVSIFIDGRATHLSQRDVANLLRGTTSATVQKVEIMSNPSADFDASNSGGVINIIRKKNKNDGLSGNINLRYGQWRYAKYNGGLNLAYKKGKFNFFLNNSYDFNDTYRASDAITDLFNQNILTAEYISDNYHRRTFKTYSSTFGIDYTLSKKTSLSLLTQGYFSLFDNTSESFSDIFNSAKIKNAGYGFLNNSLDHTNNYSSSLRLTHTLDTTGKKFTIDGDYATYFNNSDQFISNAINNALGVIVSNSDILLDQNGKLNIYSGKFDYYHPVSKTLSLSTGMKSSFIFSTNKSDFYNIISQKNTIDMLNSNHFDYSENINAIYLHLNKTYKKLSAQIGLRGEYTRGQGQQLLTGEDVTQNYFKLFPSTSFGYKINQNNRINLKFSKRIDRPAYANLNPLQRFINSTNYTQGNPELKPQIAYNAELAYSFKNAYFITASYSRYIKFISNWIFTDAGNTITVSKPVNFRNFDFYNVDISHTKKLSAWLSTSNSLTLYYRIFKGSNNYKLDGGSAPSFFYFSNNNLRFNDKVSGEVSFRYFHKSSDGLTSYNTRNNLSVGLRSLLFNKQGSISLNISDIFFMDNFKWITTTEKVNEHWDVKNETRAVRLNFSYRFGKTQSNARANTGSDEEKRRTTTN
ncbi:MAG: TonB dependent receptor [Bacteroidota bacterium]